MKASVVIPTYNEVENLKPLVEAILSAEDVEVVVVDDGSPDGTGELAKNLSHSYNVKLVQRGGKKGLSSAILDGFNAASSDIVGVIDADFSHPPELIPKLIEPITSGKAEVVFASRRVKGAGVEGWPLIRKITSAGAALLARPLTSVKDPMSGYFFLRKSVIEGVKLDTIGFKLGLEVLVKGRYKTIVTEVPYVFRDRRAGKSKLTGNEYMNYLKHLVRLYRFRLGI